MNQKVFRAFGYIIVQNNWDRDEIFSDSYCKDGVFVVNKDLDPGLTINDYNPLDYNHVWFITQGCVTTTGISTGKIQTHGPGYNTLTDEVHKGLLRMRVLEPTSFFCLSANSNLNRVPIIPKVKFFSLREGDSFCSSHTTKLFLASGKIRHGDKVIEGTSQVVINPEQQIIALDKCYGLVFE